jgi:hypothetical protein
VSSFRRSAVQTELGVKAPGLIALETRIIGTPRVSGKDVQPFRTVHSIRGSKIRDACLSSSDEMNPARD